MKMARADFVTALALIALSVGALVESLAMPRFEDLSVNPYTVPGIVPGLLSAGLLALATILLVRSIVRGGWRLDAGGARRWLTSAAASRLYLSLVLTLGYAAGLVGRLPFWLATGLFMFCFIALFEWRGGLPARARAIALGIALGEAVIVTIAVTLVFQEVFLVRLP